MKVKSESEVAQSCLTLSDFMDCSLPGPSVHGIFQARVLEWVAIAFSMGRVQVRLILQRVQSHCSFPVGLPGQGCSLPVLSLKHVTQSCSQNSDLGIAQR